MWLLIVKLRSVQQNQSAESKQYHKAAKALLVLIPLLGVGYMLLLVTPTQETWRVVFKIAQAVLTSTQVSVDSVKYSLCMAHILTDYFHSTRASLSPFSTASAMAKYVTLYAITLNGIVFVEHFATVATTPLLRLQIISIGVHITTITHMPPRMAAMEAPTTGSTTPSSHSRHRLDRAVMVRGRAIVLPPTLRVAPERES